MLKELIKIYEKKFDGNEVPQYIELMLTIKKNCLGYPYVLY